MTGSYRTILTFSVGSYVVLTQLEQEFQFHQGVTIGTSFDGESFILAAECEDFERAIWEVRALVLTFDPTSTILRQVPVPEGTYDSSAV